MNRFRRIVMWLALGLIIWLACSAAVAAFYGAARSRAFFNSMPWVIYWSVLAVLLTAGLVTFRRLARSPGLLTIHAGCVLILGGAMWGSQTGHVLRKRLWQTEKIHAGYMVVHEGEKENRILSDKFEVLGRLPFEVYLADFRMEHYPVDGWTGPWLLVQARTGQRWKVKAQPGEELQLGEAELAVRIRVVRVFENFRIIIDKQQRIVTDEPGQGRNPALEFEINRPGEPPEKRYAFARFAGHHHPNEDLMFGYVPPLVKDYLSDLVVLADEKPVQRELVEVNHPLHYGGYYFYQHDYDQEAGRFTILRVASDTGLNAVYAGYVLLCLGVFWHFWLRHIGAYLAQRARHGA